MDKDIIKGLKFGFGIFVSLSVLFGLVFAVGFHNTSDVLSGTFVGNFLFNGSVEFKENVTFNNTVDFTTANVSGLNIISNTSLDLGNDEFTKLLIKSDNSDLDTTFVDSSSSAHTISRTDVDHSISTSKFGRSSIYFDGNDYLTMPDSADWAYGTGDFTIDFWVKRTRSGVQEGLLGQHIASGNGNPRNVIHFEGNKVWYYDYDIQNFNSNADIADTNWHHIAYVRNSNNLTLYIDGVYDNSIVSASSNDNTNTYYIGYSRTSQAGAAYFQGYMDEIRISKGIARWTQDFTPPNFPYDSQGLFFTDAQNSTVKIN